MALLLLPLALSGCRLDAALEIRVDRDGAGRVEVRLRADEQLERRAADAGVDPLGRLAAEVRELGGQGWRVTDDRGGRNGRAVSLSAPFTGPEAFDALMASFAEALAAPELRPVEALRMTLGEQTVRVAGAVGLVPTDTVAEHGVGAGAAVGLLAEAVRFEVRLSLPGAVLHHNADEEAGGVLVWRVAAGQRVPILAEGVRPRSRLGLLVAGGVLATLLSALALRRSDWGRPPRPRPVARPAPPPPTPPPPGRP